MNYVHTFANFSLKKIEKAVAGLFLDNPLARASDESSIGGLVTTVTDFWTDNFSWDYGRFSPKNILVPTDEKVQRDEEKLLEKNAAIDEDVDESLYDEIFNNVDYEDHFKHMQMETDSSQKVKYENLLVFILSQHNLLMTLFSHNV